MAKNQSTSDDGTANRIVTHEQLVAEARQFNLLSNIFMSVALNDIPSCQYVLRILTGIEDLTVREIRSQYRISKLESHDAILDILAEDGRGRIFNLEIQRADTIDHARRTRFYGSMVDSEYLKKGSSYADLPDVYVIYISETDLWKAGYTAYPVVKQFMNTEVPYEDGRHVLYVNAAVDDGSETARLMRYFKTADPNDMTHGDLSKRVHYLKCEEGGEDVMCEVAEKIFSEGEKSGFQQGQKSGFQQGEKSGFLKGMKTSVQKMHENGCPDHMIIEVLGVNNEQIQEWLYGKAPQEK